VPDAGELLLALEEPGVAARLRGCADVPHVHHELERLGVDLVDQPVEPLDLELGIGRVAEDAEADLTRGQRRERTAARREQKG
jgi:hypothetical protein